MANSQAFQLAGVMGMPQLRFQVANVVSAVVWLPVLMLPGAVAGKLFEHVPGFGESAFLYVFIAFVALPVLVGLYCWLRRRRRATISSTPPSGAPTAAPATAPR